ncbi:MAG: hypothetical protein ACYSWO_02670 [Planctomycetota bacterium]|jgi:regulator of replication initiation timing
MKKRYRTLTLVVLVVLAFGGVLVAAEGERSGQLRGVFVRLAERRVGERGYLGIVVKPFERDNHVTVLVPTEYEELRRSARSLEPGDKLEIFYVSEHGEIWIQGIEAERRREEGEKGPEGGKKVEIRREVRRGPERGEERREGEKRMEVRRQMERPAERMRMDARREAERRIVLRRDSRREPDRPREERARPRPLPHEQLERQLREVITRHVERMSAELREVLTFNIERMQAEIRELRAHAENMRREVEELRAENERLRRQLAERVGPRREDQREMRMRRESDRRPGDRERQEREIGRRRERDERREPDSAE